MKQPLKMLTLAFLTSCSFPEENACTMEFRTVGLQTPGLQLTKHHTLRLSTGDTLRYDTLPGISPGYYIVLDDAAVTWLKGTAENFLFEGWLGDSLVMSEPYRIAADACHIELVSGKTNWP